MCTNYVYKWLNECMYLYTTQIDIVQRGTWPIMTINLITELSLTDALMMSLTCTVTVGQNNSDLYDIRWNGMALKHSSWIHQSNVSKYGDNIEKKLVFEPWLNSFAGEYTCHLFKKNNLHSVLYNKNYVISGMRINHFV